jgi:hypothetical protein
MSKSKLDWIGLQFFAEGDGGEGGNPDGGANPDGNNQGDNNPAPKTFTQEEVNRMLANEKRQGRQSVLKDLGLDPANKDAVKNAKAALDGLKTQQQLDNEALEAAKAARTEAEGKALAAERKLSVLTSGCKPEYIDEVIALATAKTTDTTTFEDALKGVKEKCAAFFAEADPGTGNGQGHKRTNQGDKPGSFGARLAQNVVSSKTAENPYFKN